MMVMHNLSTTCPHTYPQTESVGKFVRQAVDKLCKTISLGSTEGTVNRTGGSKRSGTLSVAKCQGERSEPARTPLRAHASRSDAYTLCRGPDHYDQYERT